MSGLIERLEYIAAILDANKDKFAVPDHITAKAKTVREAAARIRVLEEALLEARLQLEYIDARSPSGTTPAIITRITHTLGDKE